MESEFVCPRCGSKLERVSDGELHCAPDDLTFQRVEGVWRFLLPDRKTHYAEFVDDYQTVRRAEHRFSDDPAYFQALPFEDRSERRVGDWRIRTSSYRALLEKVIQPYEHQFSRLRILDMGAGNCWLSHRLAERGHWIAAVDLLVNNWDGLGAHRHYPTGFTLVQAEFDRLPFPHQYVDLIIFNASLHYSEDYALTLHEALRCLRPHGSIVVVDSPLYSAPESGRQMVAERERLFEAAYGLKSDALRSENFLTETRLAELADDLSIRWKRHHPDYGLRWYIRPLLAAIRRQRQPARFVILVATQMC